MKKKLLALFLAVAVGSTGIVASAKNNSDTSLPNKKVSFSFSSAAQTDLRAKEDSSSHYIKNNSGFDLWVRSLNSSNTNLTYKGRAIVKGGQWRIHNSIYEKGYRSCKLDITSAKSGVSGYLKGVWSPDSLGSYPFANP